MALGVILSVLTRRLRKYYGATNDISNIDAIDLLNNDPINARNAANTANVALVKLNASNVTEFPNASGNLFDGPVTFNGAATFNAGGAFSDVTTLTAITTAGAGTYLAAAIAGAGEGINVITRNCNGASRTDTTDTAAAIVAAITAAVVGSSVEFIVENISSAGQTITVAGGVGVTIPGDTDLTIPSGASRTFVLRCTNVTGGAEACTLYRGYRTGSSINDANGLPVIGIGTTASAVNSVTVTNQSTGVNASVAAAGETNTGLDVSGKGTGAVNVFTGGVARKQFAVIDTAGTIINNLTVTGAATTAPPQIAIGTTTDANVGITVAPKATGAFNVTQSGNTGPGLSVVGVSSAVNGLLVTPAATGSPALLSSAVAGADANAGVNLSSNGTGALSLATGNNARVQAKIIDTAGTIINRITVTGNVTTANPIVALDTTTDANVSTSLNLQKGTGTCVIKAPSTFPQSGVTYATPTYALDTTLGTYIAGATAAGNVTVNAATVLAAGTCLTMQFTSDAGGGRVITFGTGFRPTGTLTLTASKTHVIQFWSDGTNWVELARSASAIT